MATRGVKQLQKLKIRYCEIGGSSASLRSYLQSQSILSFAKSNPTVDVIVKPRNGKHPYIQGEYPTGARKQICVKNATIGKIKEVMEMLNNTSGRKIVKLGGLAVRTDTPSCQGIWSPMLDLPKESFGVTIVGGDEVGKN